MWQEYYEKLLYPLQDKAIRVMAQSNTPFYLTGGTALSRKYLAHRYSDDLDFFVNQDENFERYTAIILKDLQSNFEEVKVSMTYDSFARFYVKENLKGKEVKLKVEFINDVLFHVGGIENDPMFHRTDNLDNILSNKICALSREEPKDWADIWHIALTHPFLWKKAIENAQQKDMWVDESQVLIFLENFDLEKLHEVKWIEPFDIKKAERDRDVLLKDVLLGSENSLCKKG